jgi:hypothetical protein
MAQNAAYLLQRNTFTPHIRRQSVAECVCSPAPLINPSLPQRGFHYRSDGGLTVNSL